MNNPSGLQFLKDTQSTIKNFFSLEKQLNELSDSLYSNRQRLQLFLLTHPGNKQGGRFSSYENCSNFQVDSEDDRCTLDYRNTANAIKEDLKAQVLEGENKDNDENKRSQAKLNSKPCPHCSKMITHKYMRIHIQNLHKKELQK